MHGQAKPRTPERELHCIAWISQSFSSHPVASGTIVSQRPYRPSPIVSPLRLSHHEGVELGPLRCLLSSTHLPSFYATVYPVLAMILYSSLLPRGHGLPSSLNSVDVRRSTNTPPRLSPLSCHISCRFIDIGICLKPVCWLGPKRLGPRVLFECLESEVS